LPRPCEASPTLTLAGGGDGTGPEAIRTLLKRDCLLKILLPPPSAGWRSQKFSGIDLQHGREFAEDFKPRTEACYASSGRSDFRLRRQLTGQPAGPFAYRALPIAIPDNLHDVIAGSAPVIKRGPKDGTVASSGHSSMLTARSAVWQVTNNLVLFLFLAGRMIKDDEPNPSLSSM
jgi:hypothetical protein